MAIIKTAHATYQLDVSLISQNVSGNFSTVNVHLYAYSDSGWSGNASGIGFSVSTYGSGSFSFNGTSIDILNQTLNVYHNADGSYGTLNVSAHTNATGTSTYGGPVDISQGLGIPTIPRASNSTLSANPIAAGSAVTINTNRASASFTHTINYAFGSKSGTIAGGVGASVSWTPPLDLLTAIPNATSGVGTITTYTYNGGTLIGTTAINFTLTAPATVAPTIGSVSASEAVAAVANAVGGYVQGASRLNLGIQGAAGAYGSTITAYKITVDGQTINAATGTTGIINSSGTVTVIATVTDSRGRTGSTSTTVTVLPYAPPSIDTTALSLTRVLVDGTPNDDGTYIKAILKASATSLKPSSTEKNSVTYRLSTRQHGTSVWTQVASGSGTGIALAVTKIVGTYDITHSWDVLIEVIDIFATTALSSTVATGAIFMHWDASLGLGIGKYREQGMVDVKGQMFQNDGKKVLDEVSVHDFADLRFATIDPFYTAGLPRVKFDGTSTFTSYGIPWMFPYSPQPGDRVVVARTSGGDLLIQGMLIQSTSTQITLSAMGLLSSQFGSYGNTWKEACFTKTPDGIVILEGLVGFATSTAGDYRIFTLPDGFRPDFTLTAPIAWNDALGRIKVYPNGEVWWISSGSITAGQYVSLSGIAFPAAGVATWTEILPAGSTGTGAKFMTGWSNPSNAGTEGQDATAAYWIDPYGFAWWRGAVVGPAVSADNTPVIDLGSAPLKPSLQIHHLATSSGGGIAGWGIAPASNNQLNWKITSIGGRAAGIVYSLGGLVVATAATDSLPWNTVAFLNGASNYGTLFTQGAYVNVNGRVHTRGLLKVGTAATALYTAKVGNRPKGALSGGAGGPILPRFSNGTIARVDVGPDGNVISRNAAAGVWFSLDGGVYAAEQ
ncbi:DUF859 family phage minor structural protein [Leifsonia aquatica]|uniref:DUF859 family phage minor structural protein n=1 Tax=Leifsonia aquatica TaxID=144185 RepID=UPI0004693702|nr:DUF859 family phage minor structural protein [Leifsonia aquatica]